MNKVDNKAVFECFYPERKKLVCWTNKALIYMPHFAITVFLEKRKHLSEALEVMIIYQT